MTTISTDRFTNKKPSGASPLLDTLIARAVPAEQGGNWNDLERRIEPRIRSIIAETTMNAQAVQHAVVLAGTENPEYKQMALGFARDLDDFTRQFCVLVDRRAGRTGQTKDSDDYTDYITLGVESQQLLETMTSVLPIGIAGLQEHHQTALDKLNEQNPEAVTDVVAKEAPAAPEAQDPAPV